MLAFNVLGAVSQNIDVNTPQVLASTSIMQPAEALGSCSDGYLNDLETDVDCGGTVCSKCADGKICVKSSDCISLNCDSDLSGALKCQAATCTDGVKNQDETNVDCGGTICKLCKETNDNNKCGNNKCDRDETYFSCSKDCKLSEESILLLKTLRKKVCLNPNDACCKRFDDATKNYGEKENQVKETIKPVTKWSLLNRLKLSITGRFLGI